MTGRDGQAGRKARCLDGLRRQILTLELEPGAPLDEVALAGAYGLSRPPLREVLSRLAGEGYVVLHRGRGAQVAPMTHKTLRDFFTAAPMIYAAVARLAATHATEPQMMRLRDAQSLFRAAIREGDTAERALTNQRFHAVMGEMADNAYLVPSLRRLLIDHTRIGMSFYNPRNSALSAQRETAADQHEAFIDAIEAGDADGAEALALAHWELSRAWMESFAMPARLDASLGEAPRRKDSA